MATSQAAVPISKSEVLRMLSLTSRPEAIHEWNRIASEAIQGVSQINCIYAALIESDTATRCTFFTTLYGFPVTPALCETLISMLFSGERDPTVPADASKTLRSARKDQLITSRRSNLVRMVPRHR